MTSLHALGNAASSRRTVFTAAAWSIPAVTLASAAPAFASSPTATSHTIDWSTSSWNPRGLATMAAPGGTILANSSDAAAPGVTLSVEREFHGNMVAAQQVSGGIAFRNLQISPHNVGGLGHRGLTLIQRQNLASFKPPANYDVHDHRQTVTFTFDRPVKNLRFTVTDVDNHWTNLGLQHRDMVYARAAHAATTDLFGAGTPESPWHRNPDEGAVDNVSSSQGNVTVQYDGTELSVVELTFFNGYSRPLINSGVQAVWISRMSFDVESDA